MSMKLVLPVPLAYLSRYEPIRMLLGVEVVQRTLEIEGARTVSIKGMPKVSWISYIEASYTPYKATWRTRG